MSPFLCLYTLQGSCYIEREKERKKQREKEREGEGGGRQEKESDHGASDCSHLPGSPSECGTRPVYPFRHHLLPQAFSALSVFCWLGACESLNKEKQILTNSASC